MLYAVSGNFFFIDMLNSKLYKGKKNQTQGQIDTNPSPFELFSRGMI
jgi:hypothetical protein